jgi:hypothetical protein
MKSKKKAGILLYELKEPEDTWCVLIKDGASGEIDIITTNTKNL